MNPTRIDSPANRILIVDDEERIRGILSAILKDEGYEVAAASDGPEAMKTCREFQPHVAIVDLQMPRMDGIETSTGLKGLSSEIVTIILTAHGSIQSAVQAIKLGVYDYITKPFDNAQLLAVVKRASEHSRLKEEVNRLKEALGQRYSLNQIVGEGPVMVRLREHISQVSQADATVLIEGESGTGKELAARAIHFESRRREKPFIVIDCAAIAANLIESELFGHERGAFTDARERKAGKFEQADGGTVFLDEIGELPLDAQSKLLRVLQEREFARIGSVEPIRVNVRIIAATNKNLPDQIRRGMFREDLYYRLHVLSLTTPPLREHTDDIPVYVRHFLTKYAEPLRKTVSEITEEALEALKRYDWRGNIRELENVIQRAMLDAEGDCLTVSDFHDLLPVNQPDRPISRDDGLGAYVRSVAQRVEREAILDALKESNGSRTAAAEKLKISRKTLFNKMQQYGIE